MGGELSETLPNGHREGAERVTKGEDKQAKRPISARVGGALSNGRREGRCGGVSRCVWVRAPRGRERRRRGKFGLGFWFPPPGGVFLAGPAEGGRRFSQLLRLLVPGVRVSRPGGAAPGTEKNGGSTHRGGASAVSAGRAPHLSPIPAPAAGLPASPSRPADSRAASEGPLAPGRGAAGRGRDGGARPAGGAPSGCGSRALPRRRRRNGRCSRPDPAECLSRGTAGRVLLPRRLTCGRCSPRLRLVPPPAPHRAPREEPPACRITQAGQEVQRRKDSEEPWCG